MAGNDANQCAVALGITLSTFNKHLASVRLKLDVNRTAKAMFLLMESDRQTTPPGSLNLLKREISTRLDQDFATRLETCNTFEAAWNELLEHAQKLGVSYVTFVLVAEPAGSVTNGARRLATNVDPAVMKLYNLAGKPSVFPTLSHIAHSTCERLFDNEASTRKLIESAPLGFEEATQNCKNHMTRYSLCKPERDEVTGAPYAVLFGLSPDLACDYRHRPEPISDNLKTASRLFWKHILTIK